MTFRLSHLHQNKGFFSSDSSETEEEEITSIKSIQDNKGIITSQNNNDLKDYNEDEELNKIIAKIEREHISIMYDKHLNTQRNNKKVSRRLNPHIKIKREEDHGIERAYSVRTIQECQSNGQEPSQSVSESISQKELKRIYDETEMLANI